LYTTPLKLANLWSAVDYRCFIIAPVSSDKFRLIASGSGYSFEPTSASPYTLGMKPWNGSTAQQWSLLNRVTNGTYRIVARHSGKVINASASTNKTQITQWTYNSGSNQKWTVTDTGSGNYKIVGVQSGRALDIASSGTANGTKVQLYDSWNTSGQLFKFASAGGAYSRIVPNCAPNSCLDVSGNSTADGGIVQLYQWNGGNNQQWVFQAP
jgi:hypothetical protein